MAHLVYEAGLGLAFTLMAFAPMVLESENSAPKIRVQVKIGMEPIEEGAKEEERQALYKEINMAGAVPNVVLFNAHGDRIAHHHNPRGEQKMDHNAPFDILAEYFEGLGTQTPEYITVTASGADATCITSVTVTPPNTKETWAFLPGEIAAECKRAGRSWPWFYSDATVSIPAETGKGDVDVRPKCLWIEGESFDGPEEPSVPFQAFSAHLPDFKLDNSKWKRWVDDIGQMCDSGARFNVYIHWKDIQCPEIFTPPPKEPGSELPYPEIPACFPDQYTPKPEEVDENRAEQVYCMFGRCQNVAGDQVGEPASEGYGLNYTPTKIRRSRTGAPLRSRSIAKKWADHLIWSRDRSASAVTLCNDSGSMGPDFFSEPEQKFCDMETHTLYPVCTSQAVDCFDPKQNVVLRAGNVKRELKPRYKSVRRWDDLN